MLVKNIDYIHTVEPFADGKANLKVFKLKKIKLYKRDGSKKLGNRRKEI